MKIRKLQGLMNPNSKVRINDPDSIASWEGKCGEIPYKYLARKIFALNPIHIPSEYRKEYEDWLDVWIEAEDKSEES